MKKAKLLIVIVLLVSGVFNTLVAQSKYKGELNIKALQLEQIGDSLYIGIDIDFQGVNVDARRSISIIPILVSPIAKKALPEVMIKGHTNYLTSNREVALMTKAERRLYELNRPYAVIKGHKRGKVKHLSYRKTIAFESWMKNASLDVQQDICGCGIGARSLSVSRLINSVQLEVVVQPYTTIPYLAYVQPEVEVVKRRELVSEVFLDFAVNKTDIRPDYMNNPQELKKLVDVVKEVRRDPAITVREISVVGYASPEGSLRGNQILSEGRAKALVNYLSVEFDYPKSLYGVVFGGENWIGLKDAVKISDIPYKKDVLSVLNNNNISDEQRKSQLKKLEDGILYTLLLKEFYPSLRKAVCKIDYTIKGFDLAEAVAVYQIRPQNLSLSEMYLVANTYEIGSQDFIDLFETAVRLYPNDLIANLNAASAAITRNDLSSANRYLTRIEGKLTSGEYYNTLGLFELQKGLYVKARESLTKALDLGVEQASKNLEELDKKIENINILNKIN